MPNRVEDYPIPIPIPAIDLEIRIPVDLLKDYEKEIRVIFRPPGTIGISPPELFKQLRPELFAQIEKAGLEMVFVPTRVSR